MVASVPELTMRTSSTDVRLTMCSATWISTSVGAPKLRPLRRAFSTASTILGWALPCTIGPQEHTRSTYELPSTSMSCEPCALWMKRVCPPTEPKPRTGEFTPPGVVFCARSNSSCERWVLAEVGFSAVMIVYPRPYENRVFRPRSHGH